MALRESNPQPAASLVIGGSGGSGGSGGAEAAARRCSQTQCASPPLRPSSPHSQSCPPPPSQRYGSIKACFKEIDADGSGLIRRNELRKFLNTVSKSIPDAVISGLIAYVDSDGDTKTLSMPEFCKMFSEEFLDDV